MTGTSLLACPHTSSSSFVRSGSSPRVLPPPAKPITRGSDGAERRIATPPSIVIHHYLDPCKDIREIELMLSTPSRQSKPITLALLSPLPTTRLNATTIATNYFRRCPRHLITSPALTQCDRYQHLLSSMGWPMACVTGTITFSFLDMEAHN